MSLLLVILALGCAPKSAVGRAGRGDEDLPLAGHLGVGQLVLAHTNDLHAHFMPEVADWRQDHPLLGGMVAIDARVRALERTRGADSVLYLDAGDVLTGTPLMELEVDGLAGGGMATLLNTIGVDGWVLGNHEFDRGFDHASAFVAAMDAPAVSANLKVPCGADTLVCDPAIADTEPWRIYTVNGMKVGVFGLTTSGLSHLTDSSTMARMVVLDHAQAAQAAVDALEPQVDLVVGLTHIGIEADRTLAQAVRGIDLIVGGHSHTRMEHAEHVGDTWIVQAGCYGRLLGIAELTVEDHAISAIDWRAEELDPDDLAMPARDEVVDLVDRYQDALDDRFGQPVGTAIAPLMRSPGPETPLGRWAADVVRVEAGADIGLYNPGGIRSDLAAGPLTVGSLYNVFPFGNELVTFDLSGSDLLGIMLSTASAIVQDNRGALQWSGVQAQWRIRLGAPELVSVTVGSEELVLSRTYMVATNSFVAAQWKSNLGVKPGRVTGTGRKVLDAAVAYARTGDVSAPSDWRLKQLSL